MIKNFGNITAHGITFKEGTKAPADLFWVDPKGHENFWCSVLGGTSGTSSSPRTELRETDDAGQDFNWLGEKGLHVMTGTVRVEKVPSSRKVIVGQIHAHKAPDPFLMVSWWNDEMRIDSRPTPDAKTVTLARVKCVVGQVCKFALVVKDGTLTVNLSGFANSQPIDVSWDDYPFYFKRGAYVIDHEGTADEGGWVVYEASEVVHGE